MQVTKGNLKGDTAMFKHVSIFKKGALIVLVLAIGLAVLPVTGASAASLNDQTNAQPDFTRLERVWMREQVLFNREGTRLANASIFIARVQSLINKASQKGWDTSSVQAALDALNAVIPAAQGAHNRGTAIIASHAGFDASGKVTDHATAIATTKSLAQVLKDTRTAMNGTGKALREAIRAFREAHPRPADKPAN
jgi:hypothetical protein